MLALQTQWPSAPPCAELGNSEIHVWCVALDQPEPVYQRLRRHLSKDEERRVARFRFPSDGRRFSVARGVLRELLGSYLHITADRVALWYEPQGKPVLAECDSGEALNFNISHSQGMGLIAFGRASEIGVDLEAIRGISDVQEIVNRNFSARERAEFNAIPSERRLEAFFDGWTRKEAVSKAIGEGLALPLEQFTVSLTPGVPAMLRGVDGDSHEGFRWTIWDLRPRPGFVGALAVKGYPERLSCWTWECTTSP